MAPQGGLREVLVHTGQHFDANMSDVFFAELGMTPPAHQLDIHGGRHGAMTGQMLAAVEQVLVDEVPDAVLVYGDTNSTLAGALAAVKLHIPVAHVEAGLRSFNLAMPEEVNRILTDRISRWLFTPTELAREHLLREGVDAARIVPVGDVMYDVALHHGARARAQGGMLARLGLVARGYALATVHRAENTDDPKRLAVIVDALGQLSNTLPVVWPLHPAHPWHAAKPGCAGAAAEVIAHGGACGLSRHGAAGNARSSRGDGLWRRSEGGLLPSSALRNTARGDGVGGTGGGRLESPGRAAGCGHRRR
jgi:UDP-GlcNAc3NAcA epimerase